ncbi:hypothetical protein [Devosia sediminis]|uniref:Uncharacterized protein n=1 Tax=Devosia sediminis TaxID=2798801 RepID=A0A934IZX5_9HYPH|nr:hypothetical protein [Devosia sediminis]MBJ3785307.1 hypothetical protein [Devosia sediminis]
MIGDFRYETRPSQDCIAIRMLWEEGERYGVLEMPHEIHDDMVADDWPASDGPMSINSALAYGLFLSLQSGRALRLTGDVTVWKDQWGHILKRN